MFDANGSAIPSDSDEAEGEADRGVRNSTLAARLKAIYKDVDAVDAFVGMVSEPQTSSSADCCGSGLAIAGQARNQCAIKLR